MARGELPARIRELPRFGPGDRHEVPAGASRAARFEAATAELESWLDTDA